MTWNSESGSGRVEIILEKDGENIKKEFDGSTTIGDAVNSVAQEHNVKRFDLEDNDGNEISESQSGSALSSFATPLHVTPVSGGY